MFANLSINKNTIAIGVGACFVILILLLLFYSSESSTPKVQKYNKCELFPGCNFNKNGPSREELINKYPDLDFSDKTTIFTSISIVDSTDVKVEDTCIQSIKSEGYVITLYSKPNFTGEKKTLTDKINIECFEKPMRSARVDIM